ESLAMRHLILLSCLPLFASACYSGYNTIYDGNCIQVYGGKNYADAKSTCETDDAHMPIIRSKEENDGIVYLGHNAWIGLLCDGVKFVWEDGSAANYTNFYSTEVCDSGSTAKRYYIDYNSGKWYSLSDGTRTSLSPLCVANVRSWTCDTYHILEQGKTADICYLFNKALTVVDQAENNCEYQRAHIAPIHDQSLNDFIKRTAIGYGLTGGVHIGLKYLNDKYVWSDGSDVDYLNFAPSFPDTTFGECVAMGTSLFPGKWMNVECTTPLSYMCTKPILAYDENAVPAGCGDSDLEFYPGDEIFSPTWGNATGPAKCEYAIMDTDKTKKVTVQILFFESNACCDTLTLYDGLFGTVVLKTFSGYSGLTSVTVTGTTNAIRMEWNAKSGAHVRGWHAKVGSV
ncbi:hypothetical protein PMAYCL1PPCAC_26809, partial [Pristionchus mayeri]